MLGTASTPEIYDVSPDKMIIDRAKTLQEIEGADWGEPAFDSHLVTTCHRLRKKPIKDFTVGDVRIMVGQCIGLNVLVPLALELLELDPFAEGDFYPGDLLNAVITGPELQFWKEHPDLAERLDRVLRRAAENLSVLDEIDRNCFSDSLSDVSWTIDQIRKAANSVHPCSQGSLGDR